MDGHRLRYPPKLSTDQLVELAAIVETGPHRAVDGVVRWRRIDLRKIVLERFGVDYLVLKVSDDRLDGRPALELAFDGLGDAPLLALDETLKR